MSISSLRGARSARAHAILLSLVALAAFALAACVRSPALKFALGAPAITVQHPALYPETIEYDAQRNKFLLGSFREGAVYRLEPDGSVSGLIDDPRLCSVLGIAVDSARGRLWVVSSDLGASLKPSAGGPKSVAQLGSYDLTTGESLHYVDLAPLAPGPHLANGIALDAAGNVYITDSFSSSIYKVDAQGKASLFLQSARFAGEGINLNGVVVHPDGYLLVIKKSDGALFKVPLADPQRFTQVRLERQLVGGDGLTLVADKELVVIANQTPQLSANAAYAVASDDGWKSARLRAVQKLGEAYPTTAVLKGGQIYVVSSELNVLIQAPAETKQTLRAQATIRAIADVAQAE
jgi:hypothetical protein